MWKDITKASMAGWADWMTARLNVSCKSTLLLLAAEETGSTLRMAPYSTSAVRGQWSVDGKKIVNRTGECLDVKQSDKDDGAELVSYRYKGAPNQNWTVQYA